MVVQDDVEHHSVPRQATHEAVADDRMLAHLAQLLRVEGTCLAQDAVRHSDLAHVMDHAAAFHHVPLDLAVTETGSQGIGVNRDAHGVAMGVLVAGVDRGREGDEGLIGQRLYSASALLQHRGHLVEGRRQVSDLIGRLDDRAVLEISRANL